MDWSWLKLLVKRKNVVWMSHQDKVHKCKHVFECNVPKILIRKHKDTKVIF